MYITVSPKWLKTCGMTQLEGVALKVFHVQPMRGEERMYHVELPDGGTWTVWSIRGVTELPVAPEPVAADPEIHFELLPDSQSIRMTLTFSASDTAAKTVELGNAFAYVGIAVRSIRLDTGIPDELKEAAIQHLLMTYFNASED